jgi:CDP-paratose 2-epimerase
MSVVVVTGSAGLVGSETARFFHEKGFDVVGIDNDLRRYFFGDDASTRWNRARLEAELPRYRHRDLDIRDESAIDGLFADLGRDVHSVIHTASQPSHDWAAREPLTDFSVNATGTLVLLEATRKHSPEACFAFTSTNKVYGDAPNRLPLVETKTRWEIDSSHPFHAEGIDESMSIDASTHSLFGVSKAAADLLVQEYGRYFGLKTGAFRGGCITGGSHSGAELHGYLSYLMRCCLEEREYTIFGYQGKQVRDNIHARDLVKMFWHFAQAPRAGEVYNAGGGRAVHCSLLESIRLCEELSGREMKTEYSETNRIGDHIWYVSDVGKFRRHYPEWCLDYDLRRILEEIRDGWDERL